jgi:3-dehydroquinate dehydratase/shikimate dehydrogenase
LAIELDANYVDVELQVETNFIKSTRDKKSRICKIVVSNRNFQSTSSIEELGHLVAKLQSTRVDIVKFMAIANNAIDGAQVFKVFAHSQVPIIASETFAKGLISWILCPKLGEYLTIGSLEIGKESTFVQPTLKDLINIYKMNLGRVQTYQGFWNHRKSNRSQRTNSTQSEI